MNYVLNRSFIFNKIKATIDELSSEGKSNIKQVLNDHEVELMLTLIEIAIDKNNFYVAKKYLNEYRFEVIIFKLYEYYFKINILLYQSLKHIFQDIENWKSDFILCRSKILAMSSKYTIDIEKKLQYYLKSLSELGIIIYYINYQIQIPIIFYVFR